jgi:hypothetical protein
MQRFFNGIVKYVGLAKTMSDVRVQIYYDEKTGANKVADKIVVVMSDIPENKGTSLTNSIEKLVAKIKSNYISAQNLEGIIWVQYDSEKKTFDKVEFGIVEYIKNRIEFSHPGWKPWDKKEVEVIKAAGFHQK